MTNLFGGKKPSERKNVSAGLFADFAPTPEVLAKLLAALKDVHNPLLLQYAYIAVVMDYEDHIHYRGGPTEEALTASFIADGISHNRFIVRKNDKRASYCA